MKDLVKKVAVGFSTAALIAQSMVVAPVFGAIEVRVTGNGSNTENNVNVEQENAVVVEQSNKAEISNDINVSANSGDNQANDNTGGEVNVDTGNATSTVTVSNVANSNEAHVACASCPADVKAVVSGNGKGSENDVELELNNQTFVEQDNDADIENDVRSKANSGDNRADDNTGGDVSIDTGKATANATISNALNANVARVAGGGEGALELIISGNGKDSDTWMDIDLSGYVVLEQDNEADLEQDVEVEAESGDNDADDNTGGEVSVDTGDAKAGAMLDTMANFNFASVEDCCELDGLIEVSGNGKNSENDVEFEFTSYIGGPERGEMQENDFEARGHDNEVEVKADSGDNEVEGSTAEVDTEGDPSIDTGDATAEAEASTMVNSNVVSIGEDGEDSELPDWFEDWMDEVGGSSSSVWMWFMGMLSN